MPDVPGLPAAQQARREKMLARPGTMSPEPNNMPVEPMPPVPPVVPPTDQNIPAGTPPATPNAEPQGDTVTISREELNRLQGAADRGETAARNAARAAMELEELQHRLTELERASKGSGTPQGSAPPAPAQGLGIDVGDTTITDDERNNYGESEGFVVKIARREIFAILKDVLPKIEGQLQSVGTEVRSVAGNVKTTTERNFVSQVKAKVSDFEKITTHNNWQDYLAARLPGTGIRNVDALASAHERQDMDAIVELFDTFRTRYIGAPSVTAGAYSGAMGSGGGTPNTGGPAAPTGKLKISERNKASEDFRHGRLSWDDLQVIKKKFDAADAAGNVDYNS